MEQHQTAAGKKQRAEGKPKPFPFLCQKERNRQADNRKGGAPELEQALQKRGQEKNRLRRIRQVLSHCL
jgi:hypothetical protein